MLLYLYVKLSVGILAISGYCTIPGTTDFDRVSGVSLLLETFDSAEKSFRRRRTPYNFENLKNCENALEEVKENAKAEWTKLVCDKITYASSSKEMWESFNTLTSYQDYNRVGVIPLLDDDGSPVFNREDKCLILENVFLVVGT